MSREGLSATPARHRRCAPGTRARTRRGVAAASTAHGGCVFTIKVFPLVYRSDRRGADLFADAGGDFRFSLGTAERSPSGTATAVDEFQRLGSSAITLAGWPRADIHPGR